MLDGTRRIALIPAYQPDGRLTGLLKELKSRGFTVITVNDGSGEEYSEIFAEASLYSAILEHTVNCGKGSALKTGLCYIMNTFREPYVVVTLDADGQHSPEDAVSVCEKAAENEDAVVIGCRNFKGNVPLRSRLGNGITGIVFALTCGKALADTQTGLRAFSHKHIGRMVNIPGDRYEYEMNVLMEYAKTGMQIIQVPIQTIYIGKNESSHFDTVKDSCRIYKEILKFSASSLIGFGVDYLLFCVLSALTGLTVFANIAARIFSGTLNFEINRRVVFGGRSTVRQSAAKYLMLAVFILACNTALLTLLTGIGVNAYIAKIITESVMFAVSWIVQRTAVFSDNKTMTLKGMMKMKHRYLWAAVYGTAVVLFTGYVMLDTFVIPTVSAADATQMNMGLFSDTDTETADAPDETVSGTEDAPETKANTHSSDTSAPGTKKNRSRPSGSGRKPGAKTDTDSGQISGTETAKEPAASAEADTSYSDENISITLSEYYENNTKIYVADVTLSSAQYLKTAFAKDTFGKNITDETSDIAESKNALFAVNGDYYGARESGYVIRNGVVYRDYGPESTDILCIYADGHFDITNSSGKTAQQLADEGVWQAFSFGPALVENSTVAVSAADEVGKAMASNPRTAVGIIDDLHYVFVVSDGRTSESEGLSLKELAEFMQKLGVTTAYNLDGGGSSTMWFGGKVINNPTTSGSIKERKVSDIVYIGY